MVESTLGTAVDVQAWDTAARQAYDAGDSTQARHLFEQVLAVWRSLNNTDEIIYALLHITQMMRWAPNYNPAAARLLLEEAWQLAQQPGMEADRYPVQLNRVIVALEEQENSKALRIGQQLLADALQGTVLERASAILGLIGIAIAGLGHAEDGLRLYATGLAWRKQLGEPDLLPIFQAHHQRLLAPVRGQLSPERLAALEAEGQALPLEQAVATVLAFTPGG